MIFATGFFLCAIAVLFVWAVPEIKVEAPKLYSWLSFATLFGCILILISVCMQIARWMP